MSLLPYDINRDETLDLDLARKLRESATLALAHYVPGGSIHSVAIHCQKALSGKSAGSDKFRMNLIVEKGDDWFLLTLYGNAKHIDLKLREQRSGKPEAYDFDRLYSAASDLDAEMRLVKQISAARDKTIESDVPSLRFMPMLSQEVAIAIIDGQKRHTEIVAGDDAFAAFMAGIEPEAPVKTLPFGDW